MSSATKATDYYVRVRDNVSGLIGMISQSTALAQYKQHLA